MKLLFETEVDSDADFPDADLVIASDGINSKIRNKYAQVFKPDIVTRPNRFIWLGTHQPVRRLHLHFREDRARLVPGAHLQVRRQHHHLHRRDARGTCGRRMAWTPPSMDESIAFCEKLFADDLQGHKLMTNARHLRGSAWLNFQRITCEQWSHFNGRAHVVLMGDAVHTAHFAIGSGTKLAIEDAIELTRQFKELGDTPSRFPRCCSATRRCAASTCCALQNAAWNAMEWFENVGRALRRPAAARAVHVLDADAQPAHQPREPAPARQGLARRLRALVRRTRRAAAAGACAGAAADVHALHGARRHAEEPRRRLADGAVLLHRRPARRLPPGAPGRARDGRRRPGGGRDDLPLARRAHHARLPGAVERGAARRAGSASSTMCMRTATPRSHCSWAMPGPRARPTRPGTAPVPTTRCPKATGR